MWYADIYIARRRVRKPLSTDKRVSEEKLADLIKDREAERYGHAQRDIKWPLFRVKYLDWAKGSKATETYNRDQAAIVALEKFQPIHKLADIGPELLERWKVNRKQAGKGHATINRDLRAIIAMLRTAHTWGYGRGWQRGSVKKLREAKNRLLFYTPEELGRLLAEIHNLREPEYDWETICRLGSRAGLRRGEIHWLSREDVDLKRGVIAIVPKDGWVPKTGEQRHIPIPDDLREHLTRVLARNRGRWVMGERPSLKVMSAFFRKVSRRAGLKGNIHTLRHTFASHLAQAGVPLKTIADLLGHTDINQTNRYAHLSPATLEDAVSRLPFVPGFGTKRVPKTPRKSPVLSPSGAVSRR